MSELLLKKESIRLRRGRGWKYIMKVLCECDLVALAMQAHNERSQIRYEIAFIENEYLLSLLSVLNKNKEFELVNFIFVYLVFSMFVYMYVCMYVCIYTCCLLHVFPYFSL